MRLQPSRSTGLASLGVQRVQSKPSLTVVMYVERSKVGAVVEARTFETCMHAGGSDCTVAIKVPEALSFRVVSSKTSAACGRSSQCIHRPRMERQRSSLDMARKRKTQLTSSCWRRSGLNRKWSNGCESGTCMTHCRVQICVQVEAVSREPQVRPSRAMGTADAIVKISKTEIHTAKYQEEHSRTKKIVADAILLENKPFDVFSRSQYRGGLLPESKLKLGGGFAAFIRR